MTTNQLNLLGHILLRGGAHSYHEVLKVAYRSLILIDPDSYLRAHRDCK